jgi:hypothetical protein
MPNRMTRWSAYSRPGFSCIEVAPHSCVDFVCKRAFPRLIGSLVQADKLNRN